MSKSEDLFWSIIFIVFFPVCIILIIFLYIYYDIEEDIKNGKGICGITKENFGTVIGVTILMLPAIMIGGFMAIWGILWFYYWIQEVLRLDSTFLLVFSVILPIVGSYLLIRNSLK